MNPHRRAYIAEIRTEYLEMMTDLRAEFKQDIAEMRSEIMKIHVPYNDTRLAGVEKQVSEIGLKIAYLTDAHERFIRAIDKYEQDGGHDSLMVSSII